MRHEWGASAGIALAGAVARVQEEDAGARAVGVHDFITLQGL